MGREVRIIHHCETQYRFFSFESAWRTLQGFEVMNMMRKGQLQGMEKGDIVGQVAWIAKLFGMAA
jgi:IS6 family transposase